MPALLGTLHAAEHSLIALLPLWAMCDRWDIGGLSTNVHFQTGCRRSSSTTATPAASGSPSVASSASRAGSADTARMLAGCPCSSGCPSCVQSPKCGNLNEPLDKAGAQALLERMLASERPAGVEAVDFGATPIVVMLKSTSREGGQRAVHGIDLCRRDRLGDARRTSERAEVYAPLPASSPTTRARPA